ncbi:MAG: DUF937 domain-containing protein [Pseudomonadota bacterium]
MSLLNLLQQAQGGGGLAALGERFGLDPQMTEALAGQFAPAIAGGMKERASAEGGLGAVLGALKGEDRAAYFDNPAEAAAPQAQEAGMDFLAQIMGGREAAPQLAQAAAERVGAPQDKVQQLLPALAAMLQGGMQKQAPDAEIRAAMDGPLGAVGDRQGAGIGDLLSALGGAQAQGGGGIGGLLGGAMKAFGGSRPEPNAQGGGLGPLLQMLDADGDGSPLDDVLGMIMKR